MSDTRPGARDKAVKRQDLCSLRTYVLEHCCPNGNHEPQFG